MRSRRSSQEDTDRERRVSDREGGGGIRTGPDQTDGATPLFVLDGGPQTCRAGLARAAAHAPELDARNDVTYQELPCRTLVTPCTSDRVPFELSLNPYRGCEFGCAYCYARYTHEFLNLENWLEFERRVFVKRGAAAALLEDLRRRDLRGRSIAIGTATDPYQPAERRFKVTRDVLEVFADRRGYRLSITTKSDLVLRDLDLLARICEHSRVRVNVTLTTLDGALSRRLEPRAPRPDRRLHAVRGLAAAGIPVGVFAMPLLPRITDGLPELDRLFAAAREAGADSVTAQVLFLTESSKKRYLPFLAAEFPELLPYYERLYGRRQTDALADYTRRKTEELRRLKDRYGLSRSWHYSDDPLQPPDQLALDFDG